MLAVLIHTRYLYIRCDVMSSPYSVSVISESRIEPLQENRVLLVWSFTVWLVVMNTTMFNVALPTVLTELSLSSTTVSWIVSGYSIAFAISSLTFSRLSDYLPISRLLLIGLVILGIASVIGFFADRFYVLLFARILQATGAGAVPGLAMVLAGRYIPISRRGKAMALIASAASLGFGLGPVVGGAITQYLGWNFLFCVTCFVLLLIPLFQRLLPKEEVKKGRFDLLGALLTMGSITTLLLYFSILSISLLAVTIILFIILSFYLRKAKVPFIQPDLFKDLQYLKLLFMAFAAFITHFSTLFLMPLILTQVYGKGAAEVGLIIFPGAILSAISAKFIGILIDRFGNKQILLLGQLFLGLAVLIFAFGVTLSPYILLVAYIVMSPAFSALTSSLSNEVSRILPFEKIGSGMGLTQLTQFIGGGFGVTLTGLFLSLQDGAAFDIIYRNIFIGIFFLILVSIVMFILYTRKTSLHEEA